MSIRTTRLRQQEQIERDNPGHFPQPIAGKALWPVEVFDAPGLIGPDLSKYICAVPRGTTLTGFKVGDGVVVKATEANQFFPFTVAPNLVDAYTYLVQVPAIAGTIDFKEFTTKLINPNAPIYVGGRRPRRTSGRGWGLPDETESVARVSVDPNAPTPRISNGLRGSEVADLNLRGPLDLAPYIPRDVNEIPYPPEDIRYLAAAANARFGYTRRIGSDTSKHVVSDSFVYQSSALPNRIFYFNQDYNRLPIATDGGWDVYGIGLVYRDGNQDRIVSIHNAGDLNLVWNRLFNELGLSPTNLANFQFVAYRSALYGVYSRDGQRRVTRTAAFIQFRTGLSANLDGLSVTLKQFGFGNRLLSQATKILPTWFGTEPDFGYVEFTPHRPEAVIKLEIEANQPQLLTDLTVGSPRTIDDKATEIVELSERPSAQFFIQGVAPAIRIPSIAAANEETLSLGYQDAAWDGTTFKLDQTNDPAWILFDVLTSEKWGIELPLERIDILSFYQASHYNNGLSAPASLSDRAPRRILTDQRWCFDGPLVGGADKVINDLLISMNAVLNQTSQGQWRLDQERPSEPRWIVDQTTTAGGGIVYREASVKPAIVVQLTDNESGKDIVLPVVDTVTKTQRYPGQSRACALRYARWQTIEQANLLSSVEFTVPIKIDSGADYYRMGLYDLIEVHDNLIAGTQTSGRVTRYQPSVGTVGAAVTLDYFPRPFVPSENPMVIYEGYNDRGIGGINGWLWANDWGMVLRLQTVTGGIVTRRVKWAAWNPSNNKQHLLGVDGLGTLKGGNIWAISGGAVPVKPRLFRVISIQEGDGGLTQRILARPYYQGFHDIVDRGEGVVVPQDYLYRPTCGAPFRTFRGPFSDLPENYPQGNGRTDIGNYLSSCVEPL